MMSVLNEWVSRTTMAYSQAVWTKGIAPSQRWICFRVAIVADPVGARSDIE